jgi:hypothetical protein
LAGFEEKLNEACSLGVKTEKERRSIRISRKIIETGKHEDLITEQPNQVIKKPKQPEPPTSAIQIRCRVCGAPKGALCKPVNGWVGTNNSTRRGSLTLKVQHARR